MKGVYIATEDALSEAVADRLIEEENRGFYVAVRMGQKGNGYLKRKLPQFKKIARFTPFLLLTDLDRIECPALLIDDWRGRTILPEMLLFRVAVHETEAWLLADREGFSQFSGVPFHRIPNNSELIDNPKEVLLNLVRRYGRKAVKADILPERGSSAKIGLGYNQALCEFVRRIWSLDRAVQVSDSLNRARRRLRELRIAIESRQKKKNTSNLI